MHDLTLIIRHAHERTLTACYELLAQQVPEEQIFKVSEVPFSATLRESLKLGLEQNRKWTLCIDADVLIDWEGINALMQKVETESDDLIEGQGYCIDKFFFGHKAAGNHLYRTENLEYAIQNIPDEGTSLRPETDMLESLNDKGLFWKQYDITIGLHDFEQNYKDIFAKKYLQAFKHEHKLSQFVREYRRWAKTDPDYRVALWGLAAGMVSSNHAYVDYEKIPYDFYEYCVNREGALHEKSGLSTGFVNVGEIIQYYKTRIQTGEFIPLMKNLYQKENTKKNKPTKPRQSNATYVISKNGVIKGGLWALGSLLAKSGRWLQGEKV